METTTDNQEHACHWIPFQHSFVNFYFKYCFQTYPLSANYPQTSNINHTFAGNKIVDHSDIVGAFKYWDLVQLIWEVGQYVLYHGIVPCLLLASAPVY